MKIYKIMGIATLAVLLASCCGCRRGTSAVAGQPLQQTKWQLTQFEGRDFTTTGDKYNVVLSDDNRVSGVGECNCIMGGWDSYGEGKLSFKQLATTRMFCDNLDMEYQFTNTLEKVDAYTIDGNMLMLFGNGELLMVLEAV